MYAIRRSDRVLIYGLTEEQAVNLVRACPDRGLSVCIIEWMNPLAVALLGAYMGV
jgi:hypothetical protein